ncbi:kinase-like domain-containing protein [Mycena vulgaris]|nr:kinase-like domain-containing protein [Mycena vulgaris]
MEITPDHTHYSNWEAAPRFVTARRLTFELRLRIPTPWTDEDEREADIFAGELPVAERNKTGADSRLDAIYGRSLLRGDVKQTVEKHTLWRKRHQVELRFLVLRESALLVYKERVVSNRRRSTEDQCISLRAVLDVISPSESDSALLILTRTKSFPVLCESARDAAEWIRLIREAVHKLQASPKGGRIGALERVKHLTTQITVPQDPHARGGFANVYKGTWEVSGRGVHPEQWERRTVAVKVFVDRKSEGLAFERKLRREVAVWYRLDHPNIVPLLGITFDFGLSLSMVSPWLQRGTLHSYLKSGHAQPSDLGPLLTDIIQGLGYLHSQNVIHGDLHPANILITDQGRAQVSDFGLSIIMPEFEGTSYLTSSAGRGAVRWAAPEVFETSPKGATTLNVSAMSDVYSFGGIMYQVLCGDIPFAHIPNDMRVVFAVKDGQRPERSRAISNVDWAFLQRCWDGVPLNRPSVTQILAFLEEEFEEPLHGEATSIWALYTHHDIPCAT